MMISNQIVASASLVLLSGYHVLLYWRIRRTPEKTAYGQHKIARGLWLDHFARSNHEILLIQTLRNWMMSATFLASTSILVALGILGIITTTDKITGLTRELHLSPDAGSGLLLLKFTLILFLFMIAFFAFSLSIRFINHAGFMSNIPVTDRTVLPFLDAHTDMKRGSLFYFLGLRCLYLTVPMVMWLLGPIWLLLATVLLIVVLTILD